MSMSLIFGAFLKEHGGAILGFLPRLIKKLFTRRYDKVFEVNATSWFKAAIEPATWQLEAILAYAGDRDYGYSAWDRRCGKIPMLLDHSEDPGTLGHFLRRNPAISRRIELVRDDCALLTKELVEASDGMKTWPAFQSFISRNAGAYNADQAGRKGRNWAGPDLEAGQLSLELTRILLHDPKDISFGSIYDDFHAIHAASYKTFLDLPWLHDRIMRINAARMKLIEHGRPLLDELQEMGDRVRDNHRIDIPSRENAEDKSLEWEGSDTPF